MTRIFILLAAILCWAPLASQALTPAEQVSESQQCGDLPVIGASLQLAQGLDPQNITVLNWNIQKAGHPALPDDLAKLMVGVDLGIFQEARLQAGPVVAFADYSHAIFAQGYTTDSQTTGVLTLSKTPPLSHCQLSHQEPWLGTPKATSVSYFNIEQHADSLLVINLHAVNFTVGAADFQRQIGDAAQLIRAHVGPVVFAGDFNTWNENRKTSLLAVSDELGLEAVGFEDDQRIRVLGYALDHILVRELDVVNSQTYPVGSSDHNPLSVVLSVRS